MYLFCYSRILQLNEILDTWDKQHNNLLLWIKQIYNSHHGRTQWWTQTSDISIIFQFSQEFDQFILTDT